MPDPTGGIITASVIGAAGSIIGGEMAAGATEDAANAQLAAQQAALAQQEALNRPYREFGEQYIPQYNQMMQGAGAQGLTARNQMMNLLGISPSGRLMNPQTLTNFLRRTPGYQFAQQQGQSATANQAAAMGMGLSGNTLAALSKFNQGLADQTYQQQLANYSGAYQQLLGNALAPINIGQAAAANQAANVGQTGANISNIYGAQGQNAANIAAGTIGGVTGALSGGIQDYLTMNTLRGLTGGAGAPGMGAGYQLSI